MKHIFIINGSGGVGKDTFVLFVRSLFEPPFSPGVGVINFSSVDKVKEIANLAGWDGGKTEKDRKFLSDLKMLCSEYNDLPFASMSEVVNKFNDCDAKILFLHIREPKEIERAKNEFGAKTILITRFGLAPITSNVADANVENYEYDVTIRNDGSKHAFMAKAIEFVNDLEAGELKSEY